MHLARARGTPLVATLGPENHRLWNPYPEGNAPAWAIRREVPCAPCVRESCAAHYCLRSVRVASARCGGVSERSRVAAAGLSIR